MGRMNFFVLWSVRDAPRQFISKSNRKCHQVQIPLPLPKQLVIFGLGEWKSSETTISVEVLVRQDVQPQRIGTLSSQTRCLTWEGDWNPDLVSVATENRRRGVYGKIVLTVCGEEKARFISSTPLVPRKYFSTDQLDNTDLSHTTLLQSAATLRKTTPNSSYLGDSVCYAELNADKSGIPHDSTLSGKPCIGPTLKERTPKLASIGRRGWVAGSSEDLLDYQGDTGPVSSAKKRKMSQVPSEEEETVKVKDNRSVCPSERWCHTMCLIDPDTAIVIGGEAADKTHCEDSLWKLEIDNDFWFPMNSPTSGAAPPPARGLSATYEPDAKAVFVYGGLREGQCYSDLYVLDTLTWTWRLVTAKGNVPMLAYHSATVYKKELYVFGGAHPSRCPGSTMCSNTLYIFNPEFELWYQPIVEGNRPLPRFGHSTILLSNKLVIFGGRRTGTYLNDLHILDLGFMEYTAVKYENMPPLPRGFHAALPVSDNRMLVSGGCSSLGALQDVHIFNVETSVWSSVASPSLFSKPRAGHSMMNLGGSLLTDSDKQQRREKADPHCTLLVFGGSDCAGTFYNNTLKFTVEIPPAAADDESHDLKKRR